MLFVRGRRERDSRRNQYFRRKDPLALARAREGMLNVDADGPGEKMQAIMGEKT